MSKTIFLLSLMFISMTLARIIMPVAVGGALVLDSHLSYMYNLRHSSSGAYWFTADRSHPNSFYFIEPLLFEDVSPLSDNAFPFVSFDVVLFGGKDYLIGSTYGPNQKTPLIGLPLQVASKGVSVNQNFLDLYFYATTVDTSSIDADGNVKVYFAGWKHDVDRTKAGFVIASATVKLGDTPTITLNADTDVLILNRLCYDIFSEINKPHIFIQDGNIFVTVTGHCGAFYKVPIPTGQQPLAGQKYQQFIVPGNNLGVVAATFMHKTSKIYYGVKNYNSAQVFIKSFDATAWTQTTNEHTLTRNETTPVLAVDEVSGTLFIATAGFDRVYQFEDVNSKFSQVSIATLPRRINQISSMLFNNKNLYILTNEPDALIGKIPIESFCDEYCGPNAYCTRNEAVRETCSCMTGYELPPSAEGDTTLCALKHEVDIQYNIITDSTVAYVFLVLFLLALIATIIGWVMWWKARGAEDNSLLRNRQ